jgi:hypothetical protein
MSALVFFLIYLTMLYNWDLRTGSGGRPEKTA